MKHLNKTKKTPIFSARTKVRVTGTLAVLFMACTVNGQTFSYSGGLGPYTLSGASQVNNPCGVSPAMALGDTVVYNLFNPVTVISSLPLSSITIPICSIGDGSIETVQFTVVGGTSVTLSIPTCPAQLTVSGLSVSNVNAAGAQTRVTLTSSSPFTNVIITNSVGGGQLIKMSGITGITIPLPVQLASFGVTPAAACTVTAQWETALEDQVAGFELERSDDGIAYMPVANIDARGSYSRYSITADNKGDGYFRLKINDEDGSAHYSYNVVRAAGSCNRTTYSIYPNPAGNETMISGFEAGDNISVTDAMGRIVLRNESMSGNMLNTASLPTGQYFLKISGSKNATLRLVKQ